MHNMYIQKHIYIILYLHFIYIYTRIWFHCSLNDPQSFGPELPIFPVVPGLHQSHVDELGNLAEGWRNQSGKRTKIWGIQGI